MSLAESIKRFTSTDKFRKGVADVLTKKWPPKPAPKVSKQTKEKILHQLIPTPEGREKIARSMKAPMEMRAFHGTLSPLLGYVQQGSSAYVLQEGQVVSVDLPLYSGDTIEGEASLERSSDLGLVFDLVMDRITKEISYQDSLRFLQLLRGVPGRKTLVAPRVDLALDEAYQEGPGLRFITDTEGLKVFIGDQKIRRRENMLNPNRCRCKVPWDYPESTFSRSPRFLFLSREANGEYWALAPDAGFRSLEFSFQVEFDRIKWTANLKMGVVDPSKVYKLEVL